MTKVKFADSIKNEYRMIGVGNNVLNHFGMAVGTDNIVGGHGFAVIDYDSENRKITLHEDADLTRFKVGLNIFLNLGVFDDNSPVKCQIINIDERIFTLLSEVDAFIPPTPEKPWYGAVIDLTREETAYANGADNFVTGLYATATGSCNVSIGFGAYVAGLCCMAIAETAHAIGTRTIASGKSSTAEGVDSIASGLFSHAEGSSTHANGDSSHAEGTATEANNDDAHAGGHRSKANGKISFAHGSMPEANGDYSNVLGYRVICDAKYATMIGKDANLADLPENECAFAVGGGDYNNKQIAFLAQSRKSVINPLYNPTLDPNNTGTDSDGEPQFKPEMAFSTKYQGRLNGTTQVIDNATGTIQLDHDFFNRWKITPQAMTSPELKNWNDGDRGEIIIYAGGANFAFPATWNWIGSIPALNSTGFTICEIRKIDNEIIIEHKITITM